MRRSRPVKRGRPRGRGCPSRRTRPRSPSDGEGKRTASDVTVFHLHKVLRKIGIERDTFTPGGDGSMEIKRRSAFRTAVRGSARCRIPDR